MGENRAQQRVVAPLKEPSQQGGGQQTSGAGISNEQREGSEENVREHPGGGKDPKEAC